MKNNIHIRKQLMLAILMLFVGIGSMLAQVSKTVGTRITDKATEKTLSTTAILDLDSSTKGFFLPRMTTEQRDDIKKTAGKDNGLAIYNIDIDCVEYWSERTNKWMSVCGSLPPATLDLLVGTCDNISYTGISMSPNNAKVPLLQQGTPLVPEVSSMSVRMKVEQVGTYNIFVTSKSPDGSDNGYFFSAEGQFQSIGTYNVVLKANGTPVVGYEQPVGGTKGDKLVFTINGKESTVCTSVETAVMPADLKFRIKSAIYKAEKDYNVNFPATLAKGNKVELDIDKVDAGGTAIVTAYNGTVGMKFRGTKDLVTGTPTKMILEPVVGESSPKENAVASYDLTLTVNAKDANYAINSNKVELVVKETEIEADNAGVDFGALPYYEGTTIDNTYKIVLPIKVTSSGISDLYLKGPGNIVFKANKVKLNMPANTGDTQKVEFVGTGGVLPNAGVVDLDLSGDAPRFTILNKQPLKLTITKKPVAYTIDCATISSSRSTVILNSEVGDTYKIIVKANVTQLGEYELRTTTVVQGMEFSSNVNGVKQSFTKLGDQDIVLTVVDKKAKPLTKETVTVEIKNFDGNTKTLCNASFPLKVGRNPLNVLHLRTNRSTDDYHYLLSSFLGDAALFGEEGANVKTGGTNVKVMLVETWNSTAYGSAAGVKTRADVATEINSGKYNLIVIDGDGVASAGLNANIHTALETYINSDKGWLIVGHRTDDIRYSKLFAAFDMASSTSSGGVTATGMGTMLKKFNGGNEINVPTETTVNRKTTRIGFTVPTNSHFTIQEKYPYNPTYNVIMGNHALYAYDLTGSQFEPLVTTKSGLSVTDAAAFIHKTKKLIILPTFMNQVSYRGLLNQYNYKNGNLVIYSYTEYQSTVNIYCQGSYFLGNMFTAVIEDLMK